MPLLDPLIIFENDSGKDSGRLGKLIRSLEVTDSRALRAPDLAPDNILRTGRHCPWWWRHQSRLFLDTVYVTVYSRRGPSLLPTHVQVLKHHMEGRAREHRVVRHNASSVYNTGVQANI